MPLKRRSASAALSLIAVAVWLTSAVRAQVAPLAPTIPAPPPPSGPLSQSLGGAYQAIQRAGAFDPGAATRAAFLYAQARERALRGDVTGAFAAATAARAAASAVPPLPKAGLPPLQSTISGPAPVAAPVPIVDQAALLPTDLLVARNEIDLAERIVPGVSLAGAKAHYRKALNAYLSGNAVPARAEARTALRLAAGVLLKAK